MPADEMATRSTAAEHDPGAALRAAADENDMASLVDAAAMPSKTSHKGVLDEADEFGVTALHLAAYRGHADIVAVLCESGAAVDLPDRHGNTALHFAANGGHDSVVRILLDAGSDAVRINQLEHTARDLAALQGHTNIVNLFALDHAGALSGASAAGELPPSHFREFLDRPSRSTVDAAPPSTPKPQRGPSMG